MGLNWVIEEHGEVKSTQDIVHGMADMGQPEGQVVQASIQTVGRGRHGRVWESQDGNLFLSILFRPACHVQDIGQLSLIAGLSLAEVIDDYISDAKVSLKWPNDVLINGEKCAGLLLETELTSSGAVSFAVLGLGVNIISAPQGLGVSLKDFMVDDASLHQFRDRFLDVMGRYYSHWLSDGFDSLREKWLSFSHAKGTEMTVKIGSQLEKGIFHDIDAQGNLRLQDKERRLKVITAGEVYLY